MRKSTLSGSVAAMALATVLLPAAQGASAAEAKPATPAVTDRGAYCHNTHFYYGRYHRLSRLICDHDDRGFADGDGGRRDGGTRHRTGTDTGTHRDTGTTAGTDTGTHRDTGTTAGTGTGHDTGAAAGTGNDTGGTRRP